MTAATGAGPGPGTGPGSKPGTVPGGDERPSLGTLLAEISADVSTLMRQEVALAKAEVTASAKQAGKGAGMLSGAAVAGYLALLFASIALWWALGAVINRGWSAVVVALLWGVVAAVLASRGRGELKRVSGAPRTAETVKKIPEALKGHEEANR